MKNIEIIFVDDCSKDNSSEVIKSLMEKDKRIVYLRNDINRRAFYSRNRGILKAKGKYILVIDPDDLIINNILLKAYITAEKYDLDIVHFYLMLGNSNSAILWTIFKYKDGIIRGNQEVRKIFYFGKTRNICDKLVKKEIYMKSIKFMKSEWYYEDYHANDDDTSFFGLVHFAESYGFLEETGYLYIHYPTSSSHDKTKTNDLFKSICNIMRYFYFQSDNNTLEKNNIAYNYYKRVFHYHEKRIKNITEGFDYILDILNLYYNSTFFGEEQKKDISNIKNKIIERQKEIKYRNYI